VLISLYDFVISFPGEGQHHTVYVNLGAQDFRHRVAASTMAATKRLEK